MTGEGSVDDEDSSSFFSNFFIISEMRDVFGAGGGLVTVLVVIFSVGDLSCPILAMPLGCGLDGSIFKSDVLFGKPTGFLGLESATCCLLALISDGLVGKGG